MKKQPKQVIIKQCKPSDKKDNQLIYKEKYFELSLKSSTKCLVPRKKVRM